jgi:hypothetical protein
MRIFKCTVKKDNRGYEWSPTIHTQCPHCEAEVSFYSRLPNNSCTVCHKAMPFNSRMAKDVDLRIEYHVETETERECIESGNGVRMFVRRKK